MTAYELRYLLTFSDIRQMTAGEFALEIKSHRKDQK